MRKAWISAAFAPALALLPGPLWAQQRAPTTVVACSGTFAKDSSHLELVTAFKPKNITSKSKRSITRRSSSKVSIRTASRP
jgi:hypothetical protein